MVPSKSLIFIFLQDDNELIMKRLSFYRASMQYVLLLQEVQERKKFEFVETVSVLCNIYTNLYTV